MNLLKNSFLHEQEKSFQKYAYFGKFLAVTNFDDGWKYQMQKQLLDYIAQLQSFDKKNIEVTCEENKNKGEIFSILKVAELDSDTESRILDISTSLQKKFFMTPVRQWIGYGLPEGNVVKIELEDLKLEEKGYERLEYQKIYGSICKLKEDILFLDYRINLYKDITNNEIKVLYESLLQNKELLSLQIQRQEDKLEAILPQLYQSLSLKGDNVNETPISSFQAEGIIETSGGKENSGIIDLLNRTEDLLNQLTTKNQNQYDSFVSKIEKLLDFKGIEVESKRGIISNFNTEDSNLINGKIAGSKNSDIYKLNDRVHGFEIDGYTDEIENIIVKEDDETYVHCLVIELTNGKSVCYKADGGDYSAVEIDGKKEFVGFSQLQFNGGNSLIGGIIEIEPGIYAFFTENEGTYGWISIEGETEFKSLEQVEFSSSGTLEHGVVVDSEGDRRPFYNMKGKYIYLEIDGETYFDRFCEIEYQDEGELMAGKVKKKNGLFNYFYMEDGSIQVLTIDGETDFPWVYELNTSCSKPKFGKVLASENNEPHQRDKYFYEKDGEHIFLDVEGQTEFDSIEDIEFDEGIPALGKIIYQESDMQSYFHLEGDKYVLLDIEGKTKFHFIGVQTKDKVIVGGGVYESELHFKKNKKYGFELKDGKHEYIKNFLKKNKNIYPRTTYY